MGRTFSLFFYKKKRKKKTETSLNWSILDHITHVFQHLKIRKATPILIIPGITGSSFRNIVNEARAWINLTVVHDPALLFELNVTYDGSTNFYSESTLQPYCGVDGVRNLAGPIGDVIERKRFAEFAPFIDFIQSNLSSGVDAAPYDWRLVPQEEHMMAWVYKTRGQIMDLYNLYRGTPVTIVAHSMGNLMANYFLQQDPVFNSAYLSNFISVSPPWGGAGLALRAVITGIEKHEIFRNIGIPASMLEKFPSIPWLFPQSFSFANAPPNYVNTPVIIYNRTHYNCSSITDFFTREFPSTTVLPIMKYITGSYPYYRTQPMGVNLYLITSRLKATAIGMRHEFGFWSEILETELRIPGDPIGDGTVPWVSMHANDWPYQESRVIQNASHLSILSDPQFFTAIYEILTIIS